MTHLPHRPLVVPALALAAAIAVAACGGAASPGTTPSMDPGPTASAATATEPAVATPAPAAESTASPTAAVTPTTTQPVVLDQAWATAELVDVATGATFTIAEVAADGRPVILETMAIWCSNCLAQQRRIEEALERTGADSVAYVVLAVDPSEDASKLARYRAQHEFGGIYAIADRDVSRALAAEFGDQVLNPPATPVVLISPSGRVTLTPYGPKSVDEIAALVEDHRS